MKSSLKNKIIVTLLLTSPVAFAAERQVIMQEKIVAFDQWAKTAPAEAAILNLFPTFSEPTVEVLDNGMVKQKEIKMTVYTTRAKTEANKAAVNVKLVDLINESTFKKLDPEAVHHKIGPTQAMTAVVGKGAVNNFKWCNKDQSKPDIFLPSLERSQTHMSRPGRAWCTADARTVCYETCRLLPNPGAAVTAVAAYNSLKAPKPGKDFGMATQTEIRYYVNEAEFGAKTPLANLTGVKTQVSGIIEINIFYVNQVMLFGKMVVVLQAHPADAQKSVVTALSAFGVRTHDWNHPMGGARVQALLKSNSALSAKTGILSGVPEFTRNAARSFAEVIEK